MVKCIKTGKRRSNCGAEKCGGCLCKKSGKERESTYIFRSSVQIRLLGQCLTI